MSELTIKQAQEEVKRFVEEWGKKWKRVDTHFCIFTHLSEEIGELARDIINAELNLSADRRPESPYERKEVIAQIEDDLKDILLELLKIANAYDVDLAEAFEKTLIKNKKRFGMQ